MRDVLLRTKVSSETSLSIFPAQASTILYIRTSMSSCVIMTASGLEVDHLGHGILAPPRRACASPLPASQDVVDVDLRPSGASPAKDDKRLARFIMASIERGPAWKNPGNLDNAQVGAGIINERGGAIADALEDERIANRAPDMLGGEEIMRSDSRALETAPNADPLPAAVGQRSSGSGRVVARIRSVIEDDAVEGRR